MSRNKTAVTLMELIVAILLLSLILLTGATIDLASRRFLRVADRGAELQNEINPVLLRIKTDINRAVGTMNSPGIVIDTTGTNQRIRMRVAAGGDGLWATADDLWVAYRRNLASANPFEIRYFAPYVSLGPVWWPNWITGEIIANRITNFGLSIMNNFETASATSGIAITVDVQACFNPTGAAGCGTIENPQLTLATAASAIAHSAR